MKWEQKSAKRCKREQQGAKRAPKGSQREPKGALRSIYLCFTRFPGDQGHPAECAAAAIVNLPVREVDFYF